jgi:hypothetical protein
MANQPPSLMETGQMSFRSQALLIMEARRARDFPRKELVVDLETSSRNMAETIVGWTPTPCLKLIDFSANTPEGGH